MSEGLNFSSMLRAEEMQRAEINRQFEQANERERNQLLKTALEHLDECEKKIAGHLKEARFYIQRAMSK